MSLNKRFLITVIGSGVICFGTLALYLVYYMSPEEPFSTKVFLGVMTLIVWIACLFQVYRKLKRGELG